MMGKVILFVLAFSALRAEDAKRMTVCEMLRDLASWNGRMVEVRGPIMAVQDYWVVEKGCETKLEVKGEVFLSGFTLEYPPNKKLISHQIDFGWDEEAKRKLDVAIAQAHAANLTVWATVIGMFETRVPIGNLIAENAPFKFRGFGHMGGAAGQIILKTAKDVRLEKKIDFP